MENPIERVKRLLKEDRIEQALELLFGLISKMIEHERLGLQQDDLFSPTSGDSEEVENSLILLSARVNRVNKALHAGTLDFAANSQERNRVISAILDNLQFFTQRRGDTPGPQEDLVQVKNLGKLLTQVEDLERIL